MKTLKNVVIFMAGGLTVATFLAKALEKDGRYPREGTVEYEDDRIKVVRCSDKPPNEGDYFMGVIVYKKHSE